MVFSRPRLPLLAALPLSLLISLPTASAAVLPRACDAVHLFLARGNNEPYPGRQALIVDNLCAGLSSCDYEDIQFSAGLDDVYCDSIYQGAVNGINQISAYAAACPDAKLVLSGYSEGANVVGDILGGGGGSIWGECEEEWVNGLTYGESPASQIVGILIFGDVRHTAGQSYNVLSGADINSPVPRNATMLAALANYASIMRNYCDAEDPVCADGGDDVSTHLSYISDYAAEAADWVKSIAGLGEETASVSTIVGLSAGLQTGVATGTLTTTVAPTTTGAGTGTQLATTGAGTGTQLATTAAGLSDTSTGSVVSSETGNGTASATASSSALVTSAAALTTTTSTASSSGAATSATTSASAGAVGARVNGVVMGLVMALSMGVVVDC